MEEGGHKLRQTNKTSTVKQVHEEMAMDSVSVGDQKNLWMKVMVALN